MLGELCGFLPLSPLTRSHRCNVPVQWSHMSTTNYHMVRLSSSTSFFIYVRLQRRLPGRQMWHRQGMLISDDSNEANYSTAIPKKTGLMDRPVGCQLQSRLCDRMR